MNPKIECQDQPFNESFNSFKESVIVSKWLKNNETGVTSSLLKSDKKFGKRSSESGDSGVECTPIEPICSKTSVEVVSDNNGDCGGVGLENCSEIDSCTDDSEKGFDKFLPENYSDSDEEIDGNGNVRIGSKQNTFDTAMKIYSTMQLAPTDEDTIIDNGVINPDVAECTKIDDVIATLKKQQFDLSVAIAQSDKLNKNFDNLLASMENIIAAMTESNANADVLASNRKVNSEIKSAGKQSITSTEDNGPVREIFKIVAEVFIYFALLSFMFTFSLAIPQHYDQYELLLNGSINFSCSNDSFLPNMMGCYDNKFYGSNLEYFMFTESGNEISVL